MAVVRTVCSKKPRYKVDTCHELPTCPITFACEHA